MARARRVIFPAKGNPITVDSAGAARINARETSALNGKRNEERARNRRHSHRYAPADAFERSARLT